MMKEAIIVDTVPLWKRVVLLGFLVHVMFVYPTINRLDEQAFGNRIVLLLLLAAVFAAFHKQWLQFMVQPWDLSSGLLMSYLAFIVVSTFASIAFGIQSPGSILTYGLNSFAPLALYGCFVRFPARRFLIRAILVFTAVNIVFGAVTFGALGLDIPFVTSLLQRWVFDPDAHRLGSLVGKSTVLGYLALFSFGWILFFHAGRARFPLLLFFGAAVILSFQRSMWAGLILVFVARCFHQSGISKAKDAAIFAGATIVAIIGLSQLVAVEALAVLLSDRLIEFNVSDALAERGNQQLILNTEHVGQIVLGEGYGKYSPLNKAENVLNLPDAPFHMIYNETGLVGLGLFVGMLLAFGLRALARNNLFQCWFIAHLILALIGSRILWYFPLNFLVLMLMAMLKDDRADSPELLLQARPA